MAVPGISYGEVRNTIKEIDMQIVYRRLEARKKNITSDGRMSKKQLASAFRGYHGLEAQYHAMVRMSDEAMMSTKAKNDHLNLKHNEEMKTLEGQRKTTSRQSKRVIESISEEFRAQLAYQYVYKNHSFKRFDNAKPQKKARPTSDKPEMYNPDRNPSASLQRSNSIIRPLGSLRQIETYKNELRLPPLDDSDIEKREKEKSKVNMMGDKQHGASKQETATSPQPMHVQTKSFPKIEGAMGVEIKYKYKQRDNDKESLFSAPAGYIDDDAVVYAEQPPLARFDMGRNLILMRQKEQENYGRQRALPVPPSTAEANKKGWKRVLPATPSRPSSVYPRQETNSIDHKKAMKKEVTELIDIWDHANTTRRLEIVEKVKQLEQEQIRDNPPPKFDTSRPTSAILRDFKQYKKIQEERKYVEETNQPISVHQMTVQPRPESPSVARRNEYSARLQTPSRLKRTVSEKTEKSDKFSSVSRNASFKDISADLEEMAANALLTAAERIEKEKEKRNSAKQRLQETDVDNMVTDPEPEKEGKHQQPTCGDTNTVNKKERRRRVLPQPPHSSDSNTNRPNEKPPLQGRKNNPSNIYLQDTNTKTSQRKKKSERMFNTAILATSSHDKQTIEEVHKANSAMSDTPMPLKKRRPGTPVDYTDEGSTSASTSLYMFSAKPIPQHIKERMRFEYDNYSRTTPNAKKKLELRAKNRRKIQHQNKILLNEREQSFAGRDSDRASTQVSFNESVMVFQTI